MITKEDLKNPKKFSDFVERLKAGETTQEEDLIFEESLNEMSDELREIAELAIKNSRQ